MSDALGPGDDDKRLPAELEDEVLAALEHDDATRDTVIAGILAREPDHANEIRRWLRASGALPGETKSQPPTRIGPWRVLRLLGRGGFGAVYLAESDGIDQAAVKVLNDDTNSREVLRRFAAEREALLRLDHAGIARLLDSGETEAGRPWFAMEYVPGSSLLTHCRRARLPRRRRLELFLLALDAVAHAHQRGILHRDLSANNVLVTGDGDDAQPKIIDFGIAKSLDGAPLTDGALTFRPTVMGTPEYMSPEQATGELGAVDTRSDIYSLGAQLYELLTDRLPVPSEALRAKGALGIAETLRQHEPEPPSAVAEPAQRRGLRGDLDSIVMRSIAKSREERYASAAEFAADIRRHLANVPVLAAKSNLLYLVQKYARRHRARFLLGTLTACATLVAAAVVVSEARQANETRSEFERRLAEASHRSDLGIRLVADSERLLRAEREERQLTPAWPENADALRGWLNNHRDWFRDSLQRLESRRTDLESSRGPTSRSDLSRSLDSLHSDLVSFLGPDGPVRRAEQKLSFAERCTSALRADAEAWRAIDSELRSRRGFALPPQPGLTPLGKDATSGLFEFLDLATHDPSVPIPKRGADGQLVKESGAGIVFVLVPGAQLRLGAQREDPGRERHDPDSALDEQGGPLVSLTDFLIAKTELTRMQWSRWTGARLDGNPLEPQTDVRWIDFEQAMRAYGMSFPTEAQWEHACRAGRSTPWWTGAKPEDLAAVAVFGSGLQPVGGMQPNPFGLHDVHGNAAEWCADIRLEYGNARVQARDGLLLGATPSAAPAERSVRGGSAANTPLQARSTSRAWMRETISDAFLGLRPVRKLVR